jgi:hypothetical protein
MRPAGSKPAQAAKNAGKEDGAAGRQERVMARQAHIRVSISGDRLVEGRVQSAIRRSGATVEKVERRIGPGGGKEHRFRVVLVGRQSLDEVVRAVEGVTGAAVSGAALLGPETSLSDVWVDG